MAAVIFEGLITGSDAFLDMHEGGYAFTARYIIVPAIEGDPEMSARTLALAEAFPADIPIMRQLIDADAARLGHGRYSMHQALKLGIPAITPELGGGGHPLESFVQDTMTGLRNIATQLEIIDGEETRRPGHVISASGGWPRPAHGGIWEQVVGLGDMVEKGQKVGQVRSTATGEVLEELFAPYEGVILDIRNTAMIMTGEWTVHLGRPIEVSAEGAA